MSTPAERTHKIIESVFRSVTLQYGLTEFGDYGVEEVLTIFEKEKGRWYFKDLKSGNDKFVYDEQKQTGKPEEIVRQLWLHKLRQHYKYPLDRIQTEKSIHFGREIHTKAADIVVYKQDGVHPLHNYRS